MAIWINRILAISFYILFLNICETYKLSPCWCFVMASTCIIGMCFLFEIIMNIWDE